MAAGTEAACGAAREEEEEAEEDGELKERQSKAAQTDFSRALICGNGNETQS